MGRESPLQLVAFQDESAVGLDGPTEPSQEAAETGSPQEAAEPSDTPDQTESVDADQPVEDGVDPKPETDPAAVATAEQDAAPVEPEEPEKPRVQTFEEVRNEIADDLARPAAEQKLEAALREVRTAMQRYFQNLAIHESMVATGQADATTVPERPDLGPLATRLGLEYGSIESKNARSIRDERIAGSLESGVALSQQRAGFPEMMYGFQTQQQAIPRHPPFSPLRTIDPQASLHYLTWKTEERESYVPTLEEAREEVIQAVRKNEARELARAAAEELAGQFTADLTAEEAVQAGSQQANWVAPVGPFSWMTMFGFGQAMIGNVPELDSVGEEFMKTVFAAESGQWVIAANQPESVIYLVRPSEFQPSMEELRRRFLQPQERIMATFIESGPMQSIRDGFIQGIDERTSFEMLEERER